LIASEWEEPLSAAMFTTVENYIRAAFARAIHADRLGAEDEVSLIGLGKHLVFHHLRNRARPIYHLGNSN
jgi:hypothetical protein